MPAQLDGRRKKRKILDAPVIEYQEVHFQTPLESEWKPFCDGEMLVSVATTTKPKFVTCKECRRRLRNYFTAFP